MARAVNKIILVGNVGSDPEIRSTQSGTTIAKFSLATDRWAREGETAVTDWHRCVAFNNTATFVEQYVRKGDRLYVEGTVQYGSYEKDGMTVYTTDVIVREIVLLKSSNGDRPSGATPDRAHTTTPAPAASPKPDDDLPF